MKYRRTMTGILMAVLLAFSLAACGNAGGQQAGASDAKGQGDASGQEGKKTVRLGYLPITHALAVFEEKELLEEEGADFAIALEKFSSWSDLTDALNAGRIDGASVLIELAMSAASQGIDLKAVALGHKDGNVVVVSDDVQSVADLKGKTFAIPHNQSSHNILLNDMLSQNGLKTDDVSVVQLAPSEMPSSLASHAIDGYCVAEPFGAQAVSQGFGHVLYDSKELWENSLCCGLVLNGSFIEGNEDTVDVLVEKYYEAGKKLDQAKAADIAKEYLGQDENVLELSLQWIRFDELTLTKEDYDILAEKVKAYGIHEEPPTYEDFVYVQK